MGRPVWKLESSDYTKFFFYYPNEWWDVGPDYTIAAASIASPESGLSEIPSHGWKVRINDTWVTDSNLTIVNASGSTTTTICPTTMSPTEMKELDKYLTPEVECPKFKKEEETNTNTNKEGKTTPADLPTIDLFLNPNR